MQEIGILIAAAFISACVSVGAYHCARIMLSDLFEHLEHLGEKEIESISKEIVGDCEVADQGDI
jgi:hypothetical protein